MKTSEQINELATALNKAQANMTGAVKTAKNPFFKSTYSDLASVIEAISKPFPDNGLCFIQAAEEQDQSIAVTTRIMHTSGQWIEAVTTLPPAKYDPQGYGSALTYARRYGLQALSGVPSVDDDGQASMQSPPANITPAQCVMLDKLIKETDSDTKKLVSVAGGKASDLRTIPACNFNKILNGLKKKQEQMK